MNLWFFVECLLNTGNGGAETIKREIVSLKVSMPYIVRNHVARSKNVFLPSLLCSIKYGHND